MPYAIPTSPIPSPLKEHPASSLSQHRKAYHHSPSQHIENMEAGPSYVTGPMPGIPRRSSSSSGHTTPRRTMSPTIARSISGSGGSSHQFPASRPLEGLPRRQSTNGSNGQGPFGSAGLPNTNGDGDGSLGLKLHPSPTKAAPSMQRGIKDSISSTSTVESSLPPTPSDETPELPLETPTPIPSTTNDDAKSIPFPSFEPPPRRPVHIPIRAFSHSPPPGSSAFPRRNSGLGHHRGNGQTGSLQIPIPTSASASQLHRHQPPTPDIHSHSLRPTASMIRKKSGEVVKPSLKVRSMSTPDLTRQAEGSDPDSPDHDRDFPDERSKSVRFADGDDGDPRALESVVLFLREQKVTAVGKAADPERADLVTETETENDTDASDFVQFRTKRNAAARATDEAEKFVLEGGSRVPRLRTDFSPDARGSLTGENVILERAELIAGQGPLSLRGTVLVRNVAFEKWVTVRFTLDHWQTRSEVSGTHVCHIPSSTTGDEGWDRFTFIIKLEDFKRRLDERQLILCARFSVHDKEWWDSNNGMNYSFTFKKAMPKRPTRVSGPATFGSNGFMRLNDPASAGLSGLRQPRLNPSRDIAKDFGLPDSSSKQQAASPRSWVFPKFAHHSHIHHTPIRPESPVTKPGPNAFKVPPAPDVHHHLSLKHKYCAPSPPMSPPKEKDDAFSTPVPDGIHPLVLSPETAESDKVKAAAAAAAMRVVGGQYATLAPIPAPAQTRTVDHERRSSWNGDRTGSWDSFATAMETLEHEPTTPRASTDGETTPIAAGSRSPAFRTESSSESSPEHRPLSLKPSTGDLRALLEDEATGLMTPPPSNLSSPPSPSPRSLPMEPMSPSPSAASTGESSPVNTVSTNDSITDLANLAIDIDPQERGRTLRPDHKVLKNDRPYQDFLAKFCFFESPMTTSSDEESVYTRPSYIPISGSASPNTGFPFFQSNSSNSPRSTPTPTRNYDSANDAFNFANVVTPKAVNTTPKASPHASPPTTSPVLGHVAAADARIWAAQIQGPSPSLAAK